MAVVPRLRILLRLTGPRRARAPGAVRRGGRAGALGYLSAAIAIERRDFVTSSLARSMRFCATSHVMAFTTSW